MNKEDVENFKALATAFADGATASRYKSTRWYQVYNKKFAELIYEAGKSDAQREWVGLKIEEVQEILNDPRYQMKPLIVHAVEAKLKEKNT